MAKIQVKASLLGLSGTIGDKAFRQLSDGRTIECKKPDFSKRDFSQGQNDTQTRFKRAVQYAREASKTQPLYAMPAEGQPANGYCPSSSLMR